MADHASTSTGLNLSDSLYDILRQLVEKVFPGLSALYFGLAKIWGEGSFPNPEEVSGTFALVAVFGGVLLTLSRKSYLAHDGPYDGAVVAVKNEAGDDVYRLQLDPSAAEDLLNKKQVVFKGLDTSA